jgi:replicative DNA helicase
MPDFGSQRDAVLAWEKEFDRQDSENDYFPTGFKIHDQTLGRARRGQLTVVAARTTMGKTAFMLCWAIHLLKLGVRVFWFCLELPRVDMISRMIAIETGVSLFDIVQRRLGEEEIKRIVRSLPEISELPADWSEDSNLPHIEELLKRVPRGSRSIVFVDHLHIVSVPGAKVGDAYGTLSPVLLTVKRAAMDLQVPIVVGCQLSRRVEHRKDKLPILSDLKDSGDIEAGAQLVLGLYRPGLDDKSVADNELQVVCLKNTNGPRQNYILAWDKDCAAPREKRANGNGHDTHENWEWLDK